MDRVCIGYLNGFKGYTYPLRKIKRMLNKSGNSKAISQIRPEMPRIFKKKREKGEKENPPCTPKRKRVKRDKEKY